MKLIALAAALFCTTSLLAQIELSNDWIAHHKYASEKHPSKLKPLAENGDADAAFQLGYGYSLGVYSAASDKAVNEKNWERDSATAKPWLQRAAELGYHNPYGEGQVALYLLHQDETVSKFWFLRALKDGDPTSTYFLNKYFDLTPSERAEVNGGQAAAAAKQQSDLQSYETKRTQLSGFASAVDSISGVVNAALGKQSQRQSTSAAATVNNGAGTASTADPSRHYEGENAQWVRLLLSKAGNYQCAGNGAPAIPSNVSCQKDAQVYKAIQLAWGVECLQETGEEQKAVQYSQVMMQTLQTARELCNASSDHLRSCSTQTLLSCDQLPR